MGWVELWGWGRQELTPVNLKLCPFFEIGACYVRVAQADLELILLPPPLKDWDYRRTPTWLAFSPGFLTIRGKTLVVALK
jgi:hypothetical protein